MRRATWTLIVLGSLAAGCETTPRIQPIASNPSPVETKLLALQQEREQLLVTLGEFHDRNRDLESKLADREIQPVAASYDQILSAKEAELADLRKLTPERDRLSGQLAAATNELNQARQRVATLEQQIASREKDLADLRKLAPERDRLTGQLIATTGELNQARQRITTLEQQIASREKDMAALQTHATVVANLEGARQRITELETQVARQDNDLRTLRAGTTERDSLTAQLQTATATIGSLKTRVAALDQQLKEREQAFDTTRSRLMEREKERSKLVPQYNAMVAEVYQARHRIAALEQQVNEKTGALLARQKGGQFTNTQRGGDLTKQRLAPAEQPPANSGAGAESQRVPPAVRATVSPESGPHPRDLGQPKPSLGEVAGQASPEKPTATEKDDGRNGIPTQGPTSQSDTRKGSVAAMKEELLKVLPGDAEHRAITVKQDGNRLTVALGASWLFTPGDAALTPEGMTTLKRIGTLLGQLSDKFVQVAGHTDNQAINKALQKTFPDNKALSWARAENARRALINGGMPADRTKAVGLADSKPVASNATEQGRQKNRRLELVIVQGPAVASAPPEATRDGAQLAAFGPSH